MTENKEISNKNDDFCQTIKSHWSYILIATLICTHAFAMGIYPAIKNNWSWDLIQGVWWSWQTYNSAIIALLAALITYKASVYGSERNRINNFRAAKSKLPHALSELISYTQDCAKLHDERYVESPVVYQNLSPALKVSPPQPKEAMEIFVECIRYSPKDVGDHLAEILEELQVINAQLKPSPIVTLTDVNELSHIREIAKLNIKINHLFDFARNERPFTKPDEPNKKAIYDNIRQQLNLHLLSYNILETHLG